MSIVRTAGILAIGLLLAGCVQPESASRGAADQSNGVTLASQESSGAPTRVVVQPKFNVRDVRVTVPTALRVSEANVYYPFADIVWRGEPLGNRYEQVRQIYLDAAATATATMNSGPDAIVSIQIERFHSVTEKTRYTIGGVHNMVFTLTVLDAQTGAIIDGPREIVADAPAAGGQAALAEDAEGRTQRVVIVERLVQALRNELSVPTSVVPSAAVARTDGAPSTLAN
jgi:hypothetical protein